MTSKSDTLASLQAANLAKGESLLGRAHNMADELLIGSLDAVAVDESGRCWILGWIRQSAGNAFGGVLLDRRKHPCSMVIARFPRDDVPADATGFIGLLQSEWRPEIETRLVVLLLAIEGIPHLRSAGVSMRRVDMRSIAAIMDAAGTSIQAGHYREIRAVLTAPESWVPGLARTGRIDVRAGVDNIVAVPGVGCLVEGWVMSPGRTTTALALRAGDTVSHADPRSTYRTARPDLAVAFPRAGGEIQQAGFVAFFPIRDTKSLVEGLTLKLYHGETTSTNHDLGEVPLQWLNHGSGEDVVLRCYPALEHEAFFPALAASLKRSRLGQHPAPVGWHIEKLSRALVLAIPDRASEAYRVADQLLDSIDLLNAHGAGAIVLAREEVRGHVLPLFRDLEAAGLPRASLFFLRAAACPRDIAATAALTGADRMVLLRENVRVARAELQRCLTHLAGTADGLAVLAPADRPIRQEGPPGLFWLARPLADFARSGAAWSDLPAAPEIARVCRTAPPSPRSALYARLDRAGVAL